METGSQTTVEPSMTLIKASRPAVMEGAAHVRALSKVACGNSPGKRRAMSGRRTAAQGAGEMMSSGQGKWVSCRGEKRVCVYTYAHQ